MNKADTILVSIAITDSSLQGAMEFAMAVGAVELEQSILQVSPFDEDSFTEFTVKLWQLLLDSGMIAESDTGLRLLAGCVSKLGTGERSSQA